MRSSILSSTLVFLLLVSFPKNISCINKVILDTIQCTSSPDYITNFTTSIVNSAINIDLMLVQTLTQGYKGNVDVQMRLALTAKYQSLFAYDFDVCNIMHNVQRLKIMQKWYKKLLKFGNFMENCPILEGNYFLRNLTVDPSNIPAYLQVGAYRIIAHAYFGKYKSKNEKFVGECLVGVKIE